MTLFETVKASVSTREAAEFYGIEVNRHGKALCPFHNDRHPSLYVADDHYHCFGCGAHGDVIDLVSRLFGLSLTDAARRLAADFHLDPDKPVPKSIRQKLRIQTEAQRLREHERLCFSVLAKYARTLADWKVSHAPKTPEDKLDGRFCEACRYLEQVEYYLDLLAAGDASEREDMVGYLMADRRMDKLKQHLRWEGENGRKGTELTL